VRIDDARVLRASSRLQCGGAHCPGVVSHNSDTGKTLWRWRLWWCIRGRVAQPFRGGAATPLTATTACGRLMGAMSILFGKMVRQYNTHVNRDCSSARCRIAEVSPIQSLDVLKYCTDCSASSLLFYLLYRINPRMPTIQLNVYFDPKEYKLPRSIYHRGAQRCYKRAFAKRGGYFEMDSVTGQVLYPMH
jgi:hypothetical protein